MSALRYGPAGAWPAINTIAHTVESVKLYCGKLKVGLLSRYWCFKKFHPKVRNHGEGPY